jgi:hypothetical protein
LPLERSLALERLIFCHQVVVTADARPRRLAQLIRAARDPRPAQRPAPAGVPLTDHRANTEKILFHLSLFHLV